VENGHQRFVYIRDTSEARRRSRPQPLDSVTATCVRTLLTIAILFGYTYCNSMQASLEYPAAFTSNEGQAGRSKPHKPTPLHLKYGLIGTNQASATPMSSIDCTCGQLVGLDVCSSRYVSSGSYLATIAMSLLPCREKSVVEFSHYLGKWLIGAHIRILGCFFVFRSDGGSTYL
jgi:hypothetical protein